MLSKSVCINFKLDDRSVSINNKLNNPNVQPIINPQNVPVNLARATTANVDCAPLIFGALNNENRVVFVKKCCNVSPNNIPPAFATICYNKNRFGPRSSREEKRHDILDKNQ